VQLTIREGVSFEVSVCGDGRAHAFRYLQDGISERPECGAPIERLPDVLSGDWSTVIQCETCQVKVDEAGRTAGSTN
jgi:hypothetical protein